MELNLNYKLVFLILLTLFLSLLFSFIFVLFYFSVSCKYNYFCIDSIPINQQSIYKEFDCLPVSLNINYNVFIPSQFNNADLEIIDFTLNLKEVIFINGILNMDYLSSKANLFIILSMFYSSEIIDTLLPKTYLINEKLIIKPNIIYIMKKDIQQQKGLYLSDNKKEILDLIEVEKNTESPIVVIQEYLKNPFIIQDTLYPFINRKINLRIYILCTVFQGHLRVYIFKNGFIYYTPKEFNLNLNPDNMITTGYIDRSIYDRNPLTLEDLEIYVNERNYNYKTFWNILKQKLIKIFVPYSEVWKNQNSKHYHYQLFGADVEPNSEFNDLRFLEFNKGPDLDAKDYRDRELKENMFRDSLKIIFNNNLIESNFEEI